MAMPSVTSNKVVGGVMMIAGVGLVWFGWKHFKG